ncbi:MAG: hypothetical protein AAF242_15555 [Bacteroidota bacterium]
MRTLLYLISLVLVIPLQAQLQNPFLQDLASLSFQIKNENLSFQIDQQETQYSQSGYQPYSISKLMVERGDLKIQFQSNLIAGEELDYQVSLALQDHQGNLVLGSPKKLRVEENATVAWRDFIEDDYPLDKDLTLLVKMELFGNVCDEVPEFTFGERLPYIGALAVGSGLILAGLLSRDRAQRANDNYVLDWRNNNEIDEGQAFANISNQWDDYQTFTVIGASVLVLDAVIYWLVPRKKYKTELALYENYCQPRTQVRVHPTLDLNSGIGYKIQLKF